jgi:hypothetical protein
MKKLLLIVLLFVAVSCDSRRDEGAANIEIVKKYISAVESKDYKTMESLLADNYIGIGPSVNDSINKPQAIENWKDESEDLYEHITYEKSRFIAVEEDEGENAGQWVANWALVKISYRNQGGSAKLLANTMYKLVNNKIEKSYTFYNEADVQEQLGFILIDPKDLY